MLFLWLKQVAKFLSEEQMLAAINHAHELMQPLLDMQIEVQKEIGKTIVPELKTNQELEEK